MNCTSPRDLQHIFYTFQWKQIGMINWTKTPCKTIQYIRYGKWPKKKRQLWSLKISHEKLFAIVSGKLIHNEISHRHEISPTTWIKRGLRYPWAHVLRILYAHDWPQEEAVKVVANIRVHTMVWMVFWALCTVIYNIQLVIVIVNMLPQTL